MLGTGGLGRQGVDDQRPVGRDVAGADGEHDVPRRRRRPAAPAQPPPPGPTRRPPAPRCSAISPLVTPGIGIFAGRIDVQDQGRVRGVERFGELSGEFAGPGKQVRLEENVHLVLPGHGPCGGQGGADFRGVVGVVVVDADAAALALELEAAGGAGEVRQCRRRPSSGSTPSSSATANAAAALSALCRPGTWSSTPKRAGRRRDRDVRPGPPSCSRMAASSPVP